jgi:hypothetical protein
MKKFIIFFLFIISTGAVQSQNNTLSYYIDRALQNSPLLKEYQNQIINNQADSQLILAGYQPQVTGNSFNSYAPVIKGYGYDNVITNGGTFASLVGVNKAIISKKNLGIQFTNIRLQNEGIANTAKVSEQDLKRVITSQYIIAWSDMLQLDFNSNIYELLKKEEVLLKALTESNVYRQTDYLTFLVTLQQQDLLLQQLKIQYQNDFAALNYSCGITDTGFVSLLKPEISLNRLPDISSSVFFRQFTIDSLKLGNRKDLVDFSYRPKINLFADGGFNSSLAYLPYKNFGISFGASLSIPIYDGKQKRIQYDKLQIAEKTRTGYKNFFTSQYNQQIAQLKQQIASTEELLKQINEQIRYSETLITVNGKLLQTGETKIADYIIAINNYLNAKNLLTQNTIVRLQLINQVNYWNR